MRQTMLPRAKKLKLAVQSVSIPETTGEIDRIVNALAHAWNQQAYDQQAFEYFRGLSWEPSEVLVESLYRWAEGSSSLPGEREFIARQLKQFADSVYTAVARWV